MEDTIYFKDKGLFWKAQWHDIDHPENPRFYTDKLGTMVFLKNRHGRYGDIQVSEYRDFFISEIMEYERKNGVVDTPEKAARQEAAYQDNWSESRLFDKWQQQKPQ